MAFSGCIPGGGEKTHIGLLAANPSKEHTAISLANDSTQTQKAQALEGAIPTQLRNPLFRAPGQPGWKILYPLYEAIVLKNDYMGL